MANKLTRVISILLDRDVENMDKSKEADKLIQRVVNSAEKVTKKIDIMNDKIEKTQTYYIGKAMGIIK